MRPSARELWWAFGLILLVTALYLAAVRLLAASPASSGLLGHGIGIAGFALMLMTETLYSLRKRSRAARWGRTAAWLRFHIVTGIVGPYMVLLHTAWHYNGLAGLVMLMTLIVVASGFIGRYIYTAIPRTADGLVVEADALLEQLASAEQALMAQMTDKPELAAALQAYLSAAPIAGGREIGLVLGRYWDELRRRRAWQRDLRRLDLRDRTQAREIAALLDRRSRLAQQMASLAAARRTLGLWSSIHIPIGVALFTAAFIHVAAALYYATLLR